MGATTERGWLQRILWIDGLGGLAAGTVGLALRRLIAGLYELPLDLVTTIALVNLTYGVFAVTLASRQQRSVGWIAGLSMANYFWTLVCAWLLIRFADTASVLGHAHLILEGLWVAALGTIEWRKRRELAGVR